MLAPCPDIEVVRQHQGWFPKCYEFCCRRGTYGGSLELISAPLKVGMLCTYESHSKQMSQSFEVRNYPSHALFRSSFVDLEPDPSG